MDAGQPRRAVAYYQRVYVLYAKWPERVAKAYLRSGEAFEALGDFPAARRTYQEMLTSTLPRLAEAQTRLEALDEKK
jgi:tetratricopeptide (TPR) repeat protein